jgi:hypothetical protein
VISHTFAPRLTTLCTRTVRSNGMPMKGTGLFTLVMR